MTTHSIPIMTCNWEFQQDIFDLHTAADVVHHQRDFGILRFLECDDPDMRQVARQHPGDQVAGLISRSVLRYRQVRTGPSEKRLKVGDPPVIDIAVRRTQSPFLRVVCEMRRHILMHHDLQIDADLPVCPDDHVAADARRFRHIPSGIRDPPVGTVVGNRDPCLIHGGLDQTLCQVIRGFLSVQSQSE